MRPRLVPHQPVRHQTTTERWRPAVRAAIVVGFAAALILAPTAPVRANDQAPDRQATHDSAGRFEPVGDWPMVAIHLTLDANGRVVSYGSQPRTGNPELDDRIIHQGTLGYGVWTPSDDPATTDLEANHVLADNHVGVDFFCGVQSQDPFSDRVISFGGDQIFRHGNGVYPNLSANVGNRDIIAYSPDDRAGQLSNLPGMSRARWYASSVILPSGAIFVHGGSANGETYPNAQRHVANGFEDQVNQPLTREAFGGLLQVETNKRSPQFHPEIWESGEGARLLTKLDTSEVFWYYPRNFVLSDGRLAGLATNGYYYTISPALDELTVHGWLGPQWQTVDGRGRSGVVAVLYDQDQVLAFGPSRQTVTIDFSDPDTQPTVRPAGEMSQVRNWANATLLPDGTVLAVGGSVVDSNEQNDGAVYGDGTGRDDFGTATKAELWDPTTRTWSLLDNGTGTSDLGRARLYHSASLLLPNGQVLITGGGAPGPVTNVDAELYTPGYLLNADGTHRSRPAIDLATTEARPGHEITLSVADDIDQLVLIKYGAVTHSVNFEQRRVVLPFTRSGHTVTATVPDGRIATPGMYHVIGLHDGTPSVAESLRVLPSGRVDEATAGGQATTPPDAQFAVRVANDPAAAQVWRLYQAAFIRQPDVDGFAHWVEARAAGTDHRWLADFFASSPEFEARYGALTDGQFIDVVYQNVLGRPADADGRAYWLDRLAGELSRGELVLWFSEGAEYLTRTQTGHSFGFHDN